MCHQPPGTTKESDSSLTPCAARQTQRLERTDVLKIPRQEAHTFTVTTRKGRHAALQDASNVTPVTPGEQDSGVGGTRETGWGAFKTGKCTHVRGDYSCSPSFTENNFHKSALGFPARNHLSAQNVSGKGSGPTFGHLSPSHSEAKSS